MRDRHERESTWSSWPESKEVCSGTSVCRLHQVPPTCEAAVKVERTLQATMEWEAQDEGFLAKILVSEGSKDVPVGMHVAVVVEDSENVSFLSAVLKVHPSSDCRSEIARLL